MCLTDDVSDLDDKQTLDVCTSDSGVKALGGCLEVFESESKSPMQLSPNLQK